jgi:hypothetical protein
MLKEKEDEDILYFLVKLLEYPSILNFFIDEMKVCVSFLLIEKRNQKFQIYWNPLKIQNL